MKQINQSTAPGANGACSSAVSHSAESNNLVKHASISAKSFIAGPEVVNAPNWYLDSGMTDYIVSELSKLDFNAVYNGKQ